LFSNDFKRNVLRTNLFRLLLCTRFICSLFKDKIIMVLMLCHVCKFDVHDSCKHFHNTFTTDLLCIFKLPNELIHYLTHFLYFYGGHILSYSSLPARLLCTGCFHLGYFKYRQAVHVTSYNFMNFFDSWMDDAYKEELFKQLFKTYLPSILVKN